MSLPRQAPGAPPDGAALGNSTITSMFRQGGVMVLQSVASGNTLAIYNGQPSGKGVRDNHSQFVVHLRPCGRISLQSVAEHNNWLCISDGRALGEGNGGPYSEFILREVEEKYVALESVMYPGQHIGVCEDGELQPPPETLALDRASLFIPFPHSTPSASYSGYPVASSQPEISDEPPPYPGPSTEHAQATGGAPFPTLNPTAPPTLAPYMPPSHIPPPQPGLYGPEPLPPPGATAMPTAAPPAQLQAVPSQPCPPLGYEVMDLLNRFNSLILIPYLDLSGRPVAASCGVFDSGSLRSGGNYLSSECEFHVEPTSQGVYMLTSSCWNRSVCVSDTKKVTLTKPGTYGIRCEFVIHSIGGAAVAFESVKFPSHYLSIGADGVVRLEIHTLDSINVQFTIRVNAFKGPYTRVLTSPFNPLKASVVNQLKDMTVIQLYHKPTMAYLCLIEGGRVLPTLHESDGTFLVYRDRGMGRVSLTGYYKGIMKVRMDFSGRLTSTGAEDLNIDFYVKECADGTLVFESVAFPNRFIQLQFKSQHITSFSVFLVDMNRRQFSRGRSAVDKYALN